MAIDIIATAMCDMCKRKETIALKESWRWGKLEIDPYSVIRDLGKHWAILDKNGHPAHDYRHSDAKILCESCVSRYAEVIKEKSAAIDALFE